MEANTWLMVIFAIYVVILAVYSIIYFWLYTKDSSRFLFNEKAMEKQYSYLTEKLDKTVSDFTKHDPALSEVLDYLKKRNNFKRIEKNGYYLNQKIIFILLM
ncbi:MAG: hypothetical protein ACKE8R_08455 [Methylophagaceae bacterium]